MHGYLLTAPENRWSCPNCSQTDVTQETRPHTRMHVCPGARGMVVPFVPDGVKAKVVLRERDDYVGKELVQTDENGRPVMSAVTTRDDGEDVVVYAPCANGQAEELR